MKTDNSHKISISERPRPTREELKNVIDGIKAIKHSVVRAQCYEQAAKLREIERYFVELHDMHPEQCADEEFLSNISESDVDSFSTYELPPRVANARIGKVAYEITPNGKIPMFGEENKLEGFRPVFVILK